MQREKGDLIYNDHAQRTEILARDDEIRMTYVISRMVIL